MGRLATGVQLFLEWQEPLERFESSGLSIDGFCVKKMLVARISRSGRKPCGESFGVRRRFACP